MLRIIKKEILLRVDDHSVATLKSLKIRKWEFLYLLENPRKKESMVSEHAGGRISKFST